jgi:hypothetical protein
MRDFAKSSGNAANVLSTLDGDAAISVRYFLVQAFAPLFIRKKKTLLPTGVMYLHTQGQQRLFLPSSAMVAAAAEWAVQGVLWSALRGDSMEPLVVVFVGQAGRRSRWSGGGGL